MSLIRQNLERLRQNAIRWMAVRGVGAGLAALALGGVGLGLIDFLARWQSPAMRWAQTAGWLGITAFVIWRFLYRPLRSPPTEADLARAIHRRWESQTPDLVSATEFEAAGVSTVVGAPLLQQVTISRAQLQLATIPWSQVLDKRPVLWASGAAGAGVLLVALLGWARPELASIAAMRLLTPGSDLDWPRRTTLIYLNADLEVIDTAREPAIRAGQGDPLTVYIENREGALPSKVSFERKAGQGSAERGELRQTTLRDPQGRAHEVAVATLPTTAPFEFRVHGGDDDRAPWVRVQVVPPPRMESFQITITPPVYSGRPPETVTSGVGHLQGLVGSQVQIHGRTVAPLKSVQISRGNEPRQTVTLDATGREMEWNWTITSADRTTYWLDLVDPYDLRVANPPRYEIRGIADQEPVVTMTAPATDLRVTAEAELQLTGEAHDDLGLARVELWYEIPNFSDPTQGTAAHTVPLTLEKPGALAQPIVYRWDLKSLGLAPGSQVRFWLQAIDQYDLNGAKGQTGRGAARLLSVVSESDKQQELATRQTQLAEQIAQLRDKQQALTASTRELAQQWQAVGELRPSEQVELDRVQSDQRQVAQALSTTPRGILTELHSLQQEIAQNRLNTPEISQSLTNWDKSIQPLTEQVLPQVDQKLHAVRQATSQQTGTKSPAKEQTSGNLEQALAGQQQTLDELNQLSNELSQWQRDKDLESKFTEIASKQAALREQSVQVGKQTSGKPTPELSSQEQADLARAADRQSNLAREVEQLANQLESAAEKTENGPQQNDAFGEMAQRLNEQSVAAAMRAISDELRQNHVQSATDAQQKLLDSLDEMRKEMDRDKALSAQSEVDELRKASQELENLQGRQQELIERTEDLASSPTADPSRSAELEELKKLQQEIAEQTSQLAQKLRREQKQSASRSAQRASQQMNEARETLEDENIADTLEREREALDELQQAQEEVQQQLASAEQRAQQQALTAAGLLVASLLERAKATRDETVRLEELRVSAGKWTRSQLKSVQQAAEAQKQIAESVREASQDLDSDGVMDLCLDLANEHFGAAATRLAERDAGQMTQSQQVAGEQLLQQFLASLESPDPTSQPPGQTGEQPPQQGEGGEGAEGQEQSPPASPFLAAEVRLLLGMQEGLLARTRSLAELKAKGHTLTPDQVGEVKQLHDRQKRLVETARKMVKAEAMEGLP